MKSSSFRWCFLVLRAAVQSLLGLALFFLGHPANAQLPNVVFTEVASGLALPVHITHSGDGTGRLFVVEQQGRVQIVRNGIPVAVPFLDISDRVSCCGERGLLSIAFPPQYAQKGHFYVNYTRQPDGATVIARYRISPTPDIADPLTEEILLVIAQPFANHNGGQLAFGPDGFLYIGMGDGGDGCDPGNRAQNLSDLLGKLLRVDVESGVFPYAVPSSNPVLSGRRSEIWALGLRNPWRFSFDRLTGDLYIADVGQNAFEEINFQPSASQGGENYGWRIMEGLHCSNAISCPSIPCTTVGLTLPIFEYAHGPECSVTGGMVYRGFRYPRALGTYFYGDLCSGKIWGLARSGPTWVNELLADTAFSITTFGEDESGELHVADYGNGTVYRMDFFSFSDVFPGAFAFQQIEKIFSAGITEGCGGGNFCPDAAVTRKEMAVFIEKALGIAFPPLCSGAVFADVQLTPPPADFCNFIEDFFARRITAGCRVDDRTTPTNEALFCPDQPVTRAQMAVFMVKALNQAPDPSCTGAVFSDVDDTVLPVDFCRYIEAFTRLGITSGCRADDPSTILNEKMYCPNDFVTRAQMAVFLTNAFLQ